MFFLPHGSTSFCQKTAPLPCSLFNDQIMIPSFPPSWTASAKTPTASGGNILSIGYSLMKVQRRSLKKQLIIFASSLPRCCKQDCCKSPICQPLRGQAAAATLWKSGSWGKERCGLSFTLAGLQLVHWDRPTAPAAPMGGRTSFGDSTYWSNSSSPPTPVHKLPLVWTGGPRHGSRGAQSGCRRWSWTWLRALGLFGSGGVEGTG